MTTFVFQDANDRSELDRKKSEHERIENEKQRVLNETKRVSNETLRQNAENERVTAEEERKNYIENIVKSEVEKIEGFGSQVTENTKNIAENTKDIERVFDVINNGSYLPFEGENVTIEHSKVGYTKDMLIEGMIYQNLCNMNNLNFQNSEVVKDGYITFDSSKDGSSVWTMLDLLKPYTTYTICFYVESLPDISDYPIRICDDETDYNLNIKGIQLSEKGFFKTTFRTGTNTCKLIIYNNKKNEGCKVTYPLILEGEPQYILQYFEGIQSVGEKEGKISILSTGKNLFDGKYANAYLQGGDIPVFKKGGNDTKSAIIKVPKNTDIFITKETSVRDSVGFFKEYPTDGMPYTVVRGVGSQGNKFNTGDNNYLVVYVSNEGETPQLQVEIGTVKTSYGPYKGDKKEILLPYSYGLKGFPDGAKDTLENREDGIYAIKRVERRIFSGSENENWVEASKTGNTRRFYLMGTGKKAGITKNILCDKLPTLFNVEDDRNEKIGVSGYFSDGRIYIKFLDTVVTGTINDYLRSNPVVVYYELETPIEHKILDYPTTNLETFKDITHVFSENSISPSFSFKAPVDVPATISTLRVRNENLEQENKELKEEVDTKTLKLHGQDVELTNSDLDLDFRIFELEMGVGVPINLNMKGMRNMARSPFEMMKILVLNNNYDREDIEYKASRYLQGKRMTQAEYDEIISLMDANELVK